MTIQEKREITLEEALYFCIQDWYDNMTNEQKVIDLLDIFNNFTQQAINKEVIQMVLEELPEEKEITHPVFALYEKGYNQAIKEIKKRLNN